MTVRSSGFLTFRGLRMPRNLQKGLGDKRMNTTATRLYPFVPSGENFDLAIAFFAEIGFVKQWGDSSLAGLRFGEAYFMLQNINVPEWQSNQMITFEVEDLEGYWKEISSKDLPAKYKGSKLREPTDFPWGREIHIIDPGGVCWHVRQSQKK